jgi:hypothetical protein
MLDQSLGLGRKSLLPIKRRPQAPTRREMLGRALANVVFLDLGEAEADQLVPFVTRQPVERRIGGLQMRGERDAEARQQRGAVDAGGKHMLLDLGLHRLAVHTGGEGKQLTGSSVGSEMF